MIWTLRVFSVVVIAVVVSTAHARIDRGEVAVPTYAIASGHLNAAYPPIPPSLTERVSYQPPGFPVAAAVPVAVWRALTGDANPSGALTLAGYGAAALVVLAGGRLVGSGSGGRRRELLFLVAVSVSPFFRESLGHYFHPEDVLALGLLLMSLFLASKGRWAGAGVALGLAFGSKQWVLLAVPALFLMASGRPAKVRLVSAAILATFVLYAPFILLSRETVWKVLRGPIPVAGGFVPQTTIVGMLRDAPFYVPVTVVNDLARVLPLLFAIALPTVWILVRSRRYGEAPRPRLEDAVGLVLVCLAFRLIGDCIALSYYALPVSVLIAVVDVRRSRFPAFAIASGFALAFWYGAVPPRYLLDPWTGALVFTVGVVAVAAGAMLIRRDASAPRSQSSDLALAGVDPRAE